MNSLTKTTLVFVTAMAVLAASGWFGRKAYKRSMEHRLITQARQYIEKKDGRNTGLCLQRVMQINPMSVEASRLTADLLEEKSASAALPWRIRVAKLQPENVTNRVQWAQTGPGQRGECQRCFFLHEAHDPVFARGRRWQHH